MNYEKILERISDVYQQSVRFYRPAANEENESSKTINLPHQLINNSYATEIDGNYLLFFNEIYTNTIRKWLKNLLKKIAWPIFKRQVYYNSAVRQLLYNLIQKSDEYSLRDKEVNKKFSQLEQKIEQLSQFKQKIDQLSQLEQKIEQISTDLQADNSVTNQASSNEESKIASGLWFNEPIIVGYHENGEAYWAGTNERIFEKTFVLQSLARLYESSSITVLDVGAAESLLSYELASFNYSVTAIDIRPIALFHPNLKFVKTDICNPVLAPASFDCVIALSTVEHIGLGWYGDETGESYDIKAVQQISLLLKPEGSFILTVPYGKKALTPVHRIYNQESLQKLIQDFKIVQISYGVRKDDFTLTITENELEASEKEHNPDNYLPGAVAMLVCKKNLV
ncbi:MAG: class I SAM-dependent methyltransferase [Nostoc sp.]|uniref:class I SAM-dependent methyltransferase n=1 Tax=Nostoc sp. TaxID=1180 RepID=UPI002FF9E620